jgi:DNA replication protein DnaC
VRAESLQEPVRFKLLAGDEILATAILDRLLHHSHVLNIKGRSNRLKELEEAVTIRS